MRTVAPLTFLRALLVPWSLGSLLFVVCSALLLALLKGQSVGGIIGWCFLLSWLFKYGYMLLEHVADGQLDAPPASVDMLGPFEPRPLLQALWCLIALRLARMFGQPTSTILLIVSAVLLPASAATLGLSLGVLQAFNPLTLWRVVRGLGVLYVGVLGIIAFGIAIIVGLARLGAWSVVTIGASELVVLTMFSAIGGALFERRLEIGYEPANSPERAAEREARERECHLSAVLDEAYKQTRLKRRELVIAALQDWLAQSDTRHLGTDAHIIFQRALAWNDAYAVESIGRLLIQKLEDRGAPELAADIREQMDAVAAQRAGPHRGVC